MRSFIILLYYVLYNTFCIIKKISYYIIQRCLCLLIHKDIVLYYLIFGFLSGLIWY